MHTFISHVYNSGPAHLLLLSLILSLRLKLRNEICYNSPMEQRIQSGMKTQWKKRLHGENDLLGLLGREEGHEEKQQAYWESHCPDRIYTLMGQFTSYVFFYLQNCINSL